MTVPEMQRALFDMTQVIEGQRKTNELTYEGLRKMMADQRVWTESVVSGALARPTSISENDMFKLATPMSAMSSGVSPSGALASVKEEEQEASGARSSGG